MGLFDMFRGNDFTSLRNAGGMEKKYKELIDMLLDLSKGVDSNYQVETSLIRENIYGISIYFKKRESTMIHRDTYRLYDLKDKLEVEYFRETKSISPIMGSLLPPMIKLKLNFSNSENQNLIMNKIIKSINEMFKNDYNYGDDIYILKGRILKQ